MSYHYHHHHHQHHLFRPFQLQYPPRSSQCAARTRLLLLLLLHPKDSRLGTGRSQRLLVSSYLSQITSTCLVSSRYRSVLSHPGLVLSCLFTAGPDRHSPSVSLSVVQSPPRQLLFPSPPSIEFPLPRADSVVRPPSKVSGTAPRRHCNRQKNRPTPPAVSSPVRPNVKLAGWTVDCPHSLSPKRQALRTIVT